MPAHKSAITPPSNAADQLRCEIDDSEKEIPMIRRSSPPSGPANATNAKFVAMNVDVSTPTVDSTAESGNASQENAADRRQTAQLESQPERSKRSRQCRRRQKPNVRAAAIRSSRNPSPRQGSQHQADIQSEDRDPAHALRNCHLVAGVCDPGRTMLTGKYTNGFVAGVCDPGRTMLTGLTESRLHQSVL